MSEDNKKNKAGGNGKTVVIRKRENFSTQIGESKRVQEGLNKSFTTDNEPIKPNIKKKK